MKLQPFLVRGVLAALLVGASVRLAADLAGTAAGDLVLRSVRAMLVSTMDDVV